MSSYGMIPGQPGMLSAPTVTQGADISSWLPWLLGGSGAGLGLLGALAPSSGGKVPTGPFTPGPELEDQFFRVKALASRYETPEQTMQMAQPLLGGIGALARRNAANAGIEGPLSAHMQTSAQGNLLQGLEQERLRNYQNLLGMRGSLAGLIDQQRREYAEKIQAARAAAEAADRQQRQSIFGTVGSLLGAASAFIPGVGPALAPLLMGLGNTAGNTIGGMDW